MWQMRQQKQVAVSKAFKSKENGVHDEMRKRERERDISVYNIEKIVITSLIRLYYSEISYFFSFFLHC